MFHGENAGAIDKFYSQALAAALGFTPVMDPVTELHAGEHEHFEFTRDVGRRRVLHHGAGHGLRGQHVVVSADRGRRRDRLERRIAAGRTRTAAAAGHGGRRPLVTVRRRRGRLSLFLRRDNADASAWIGTWRLLVAWRARTLDRMVMLDNGELMFPVAAGPVRGPRYARLLLKPARRSRGPQRARSKPRHRLDVRPTSTNIGTEAACSVVVNVYARTRLAMDLRAEREGDGINFTLATNLLRGATASVRSFARLAAPTRDLSSAGETAGGERSRSRGRCSSTRQDDPKFDAARVLAKLESEDPSRSR